jgi:hypothetical protein
MAIRVPYTSHYFEYPNELSESDFNMLKCEFDEYIESKLSHNLTDFKNNHKKYTTLGFSVISVNLITFLIAISYNVNYIFGTTLILGFGIWFFNLSNIYTAESYEKFIETKEDFYYSVSELAEGASNYEDFRILYRDWLFKQRTGKYGQLTYTYLTKFARRR